MKKLIILVVILTMVFTNCATYITKEITEKFNNDFTIPIETTDIIEILPYRSYYMLEYFVEFIDYNSTDYFYRGIMYGGNDNETKVMYLNHNKQSIMYFMVEWAGGNETERINFYFRPNGYDVEFVEASCQYNELGVYVAVPTNNNGEIEFYHTFDKPLEEAIDIKLKVIYFSNGIAIY